MSKWVVDIHGDIEGDYEIIKKYEEPKTDLLDKIRDEIVEEQSTWREDADAEWHECRRILRIIDKYRG